LLQGSTTGSGVTYSWSPASYLNNPFVLRPQASPPQAITYTLTATSQYGCGVDSDKVKVEVIDKLFIPTAFTPNNDGLNDTWEIITFETYPNATVDVYNRWGQKVYSGTGNKYQPWDGRYQGQIVSPGTYVYFIRLNKTAAVIKGVVNVVE
jgi:gliding motility-associated-like protein